MLRKLFTYLKYETFNKKMFVSPFYNNNGYYSLFSSANERNLIVNVNYLLKKQIIFKANVKADLIENSKFKICAPNRANVEL